MSNKNKKLPPKQILKKPYIPAPKNKGPLNTIVWIVIATLALMYILPYFQSPDVRETQIGIGEFISEYNK